jgi:hypothetical protein
VSVSTNPSIGFHFVGRTLHQTQAGDAMGVGCSVLDSVLTNLRPDCDTSCGTTVRPPNFNCEGTHSKRLWNSDRAQFFVLTASQIGRRQGSGAISRS